MTPSKAILYLDGVDLHFKTKEEWNKNPLSAAWHAQWGDRNLPHYQPRAYNEPAQFPCVGMICGLSYNPNGPDDQHIFWAYNFNFRGE